MDPINSNLISAIEREGQKFQECYQWLEKSMPAAFFNEIKPDDMLLITHSLIGFALQNYYSTINPKGAAIVLYLDYPDADLKILQNYAMYGIKNYQAFVSDSPPPFPGIKENLRIATIIFSETEEADKILSNEASDQIHSLVMNYFPEIPDDEVDAILQDLGGRFLNALTPQKLINAIAMYLRAKTRDSCQYELQYHENWKDTDQASLQIVLAWKNTPKQNFLYRLARTIYRHHLVIKRVDATYVHPYSPQSTLIMTLDLHGRTGAGVTDVADMPEFLRELATVKYFESFDAFDEQLVSKGIISGNFANILRAMVPFVHQALVHLDPHLFSIENIYEDLCRHPDLTALLSEAFKWKFHPELSDLTRYGAVRNNFLQMVNILDTGQEEYDTRRKQVLFQAMNMIHHTLKTNAYRLNFTALSFRLDPKYLDEIPFDRSKKFPELPFAIFYIKGMQFFSFHIRFKDLARGGLRTVFPEAKERMIVERNSVFTECYNLALTQHLKNKDIPEGGAKGLIFLEPFERLSSEAEIYRKELEFRGVNSEEVEEKIAFFRKEQTMEYLYHSQRSFIENLLILVNCDSSGKLRVRRILDYWKKPEYLYLGPDENMHDAMIQWIADYSKKYDYKPGTSFISSKPKIGVNHKEYGVTSLGVNVYLRELLAFIGIHPTKDRFTIKMAGGPDGDVAGNQIYNLYRFYPKTAKLLAVTDVSGTVHDPNGLDLEFLTDLFKQGKPIHCYPPEKLSYGGYLIDKTHKKETSAIASQTVLWRMENTLQQEWLSGSEMNHKIRENMMKTKADVFIPAGGRPRTLNEVNYKDFLDETGKPTSRIIIEGANLYLTAGARRELERLGVLIVRDSSANKTGVICSSFEVLCGLSLGDEVFYANKDTLVKEILARLEKVAYNEATLLLREHNQTGAYLTDISAKISERINQFTYQLLDYLEPLDLKYEKDDPLTKAFLDYALPLLRTKYSEEMIREIPDIHKKAIIACHVGAELVYQRGLHWFPSIVDILPLLLERN